MLSCIPLHISHSSWGFSMLYLNTAFPKHFTAIKTMDSTNIWKFTAIKLKNVYWTHLYTVWRRTYCNNSQKVKLKIIFMVNQLWCQTQCNEGIMECRGTAWYITSLETRCRCAWHHALSTCSTVFNGDAHNLHYETVTISMV